MRVFLLSLFLVAAANAGGLNWESDADVIAHVARAGGELIKRGATTSRATLLQQLQRKQCQLELPGGDGKTLDPTELYQRAQPGVIAVVGLYRCRKCADWHTTVASGFVIARNGVAVTNGHVLKSADPETFVAMNHKGVVFPIKEVLAASEADDIAIIRLEASNAEFVPLPLAADELPVGARVCVISHPEHQFYALTDGLLSRYLNWRNGSHMVRRAAITADFAIGSSGAPVLNQRGEVVAIACATHTVHTSSSKDSKREPQMTLKLCAPINRLRALIGP